MTEPVAAGAPPKSRLPLLLGIGAAAILGLLLVNVLGGGDDAVDDEFATTTTLRSPVTTTTVAGPGAAPTETFEVFTTKNPFLPLRSTATAGGGTTTGGTTVGGTTGGTTGGTSGGTTGGTTVVSIRGGTTATTTRPGTGSGTRTGGTGSVEPRRSDRVALVDVFAENGKVVANVRVNDTVHKVAEGETFAGSYRVLSLSQADDCGRFMFGDDTFRLCRGEETLK
ncbi:MAG: hypothetical protein M3394_01220 [Actinomycetota bacterium]|nr:hypothetical protein [Actinomycetota bacterium]